MSGGKVERIGGFALKMIEETAAARDKSLAAADSLIAERDELRAVLREIVECSGCDPCHLFDPYVLPRDLIERAEKLLEQKP